MLVKVVIPGGSGQVGQILAREFARRGDDVVVLCRSKSVPNGRVVSWDAKTLGPWKDEIDGSDLVINLAGRTVNCRYTEENMREMLDSRVDSTRIVGEAIGRAKTPPRTWMQMSTATIYAHRFDAPNGESTGILGGDEEGVPAYWAFSVRIAREWEETQRKAETPGVRKIALRTSMVMSPDREGIFDVMLGLVRRGVGGTAGDGTQYISWIHDRDFVKAVFFLLEHEELSGAINMASPGPLPQKEFNRLLREAWGTKIGLPATKWMLELGAFVMRTDTELVLKSRRVIPERLEKAGFEFQFRDWKAASRDLVQRWRAQS